MKKAFFALIVLNTLLIGCSNEQEVINYYGSLTINDSPIGYSFRVFIYPSGILPSTYSEYSSMTTSPIAVGSGGSPVKLIWSGGIKSGKYLTTITTGSTTKMDIVNYNSKGEASIYWNAMKDAPSSY